jgi:hypothetical protein
MPGNAGKNGAVIQDIVHPIKDRLDTRLLGGL